MAWEKYREKIAGLQSDLSRFRIEFLDRDKFKDFADNFYTNVSDYNEINITGYFSETIRDQLEQLIKISKKVKIICPEFSTETKRDKRNLEVLRKLAKEGAEVKFNNRLHARFLVAYYTYAPETIGLLLIGSFDFNTECIGRERYDAGIKTNHPDLIESAIKLFNQIWDEPESKFILK